MADLAITAPATLTVTPTTVAPGGTVTLPSWTVANVGTVASTAFSNGFYLSADPVITASDIYLDGNANTALAPGASFTWGGPTLRIPSRILHGVYYIGILVNRTNTTPEANTCNNFKSTRLPVGVERIAFVSGRDGNPEIYAMNGDGTGQVNLTNTPLPDRDPAWSPDGSRIAFSSLRSGNWEIFVMNADGTGQVNLTNNPGQDVEPSWSPDGNWIAFRSDRAHNGYVGSSNGSYFSSDIFVMRADGTEPTNLTNTGDEDMFPAWSPRGGKIAFASDRLSVHQPQIWVINQDGTGLAVLTQPWYSGIHINPAWSPDGLRIAFASNRFSGNELDIFIMNADGSDLSRRTFYSDVDDRDPAWSPDGFRIAFSRVWQVGAGGRPDSDSDIYVLDAKGFVVVPLVTGPTADYDPTWTLR